MEKSAKPLTVLHTSDWHLGNQLYKKRRDEEFAEFLDWLLNVIRDKGVDVLIVAGDIFDTGYPGPVAQKMYYDFLARLGTTGVRLVSIVGGNHDSPSFLGAASDILKRLRVSVTGVKTDERAAQIDVLRDDDGQAELIICNVPFLRERDLRELKPGENERDRNAAIVAGLKRHYAEIAGLAKALREESGRDIPIIATGHLYAAGIQSVWDGEETAAGEDDGSRELYMGNLGQAPADVFPPEFDYVALGHIHRASRVGGSDRIRYCGSPLPMSFSEARRDQEILLLRWDGRSFAIESVAVPRARKMITLRGSASDILTRLREHAKNSANGERSTWVEIFHEGDDSTVELRDKCFEIARGRNLEICCVQPPKRSSVMGAAAEEREIGDMSPEDMFELRLDAANIRGDARDALKETFRELLASRANGGGEE